MSFFEDASLVLIPSAQKLSKIYSVKPTDGTGDLAFTRSNDTATRVASNGLIEKVRTNLFPYSQDFSTAAWSREGTMTQTFSQTDPNGGTTAVLVTSGTSGNAFYTDSITCFANVPNTFSIFIKGNASGSVSIRIDDSTTGPQFNINYTTSWQRFSVTRTPNQTGCSFVVGGFSTWDIGENLSFAFAQHETGDIATPYIATTTAAVSVGPVANVPRLDYLGSSCPRLLLEPQRTNLITYSEQFDNAAWTKAAVSDTANNITSPDGTQNADLLTTTSATICGAYQLISTGSGTFSFSIFAKKGNNNYLALNAQASSSNNCTAIFDLSDGTLGEYQTKGTTAYVSHKIENFGNDWYRCTMVLTTTTSVYFFPLFAPLKTGNTFTSSGEVSVASGKTLYLWGCQVEAGAYATSYIPTTTAAVTRGADAASKTGISSLIGQTEGTIFLEVKITALGQQLAIITSAAGNEVNRLQTYIDNTGKIGLYRGDASVNILSASTYAIGSTIKIAAVYKLNDFALYVNGVSVGTDTSGTIPPTPSALYLAQYVDGAASAASIAQSILFPTRLSNSDLAALTA